MSDVRDNRDPLLVAVALARLRPDAQSLSQAADQLPTVSVPAYGSDEARGSLFRSGLAVRTNALFEPRARRGKPGLDFGHDAADTAAA